MLDCPSQDFQFEHTTFVAGKPMKVATNVRAASPSANVSMMHRKCAQTKKIMGQINSIQYCE